MAQRGARPTIKSTKKAEAFIRPTWSGKYLIALTFFLLEHARLTQPQSEAHGIVAPFCLAVVSISFGLSSLFLEQRCGASHRLVTCGGRERAELLGF
ncbi:hypothetical protein NL676_009063 [Syzygium grande]|nr:hypothetical protein NL676_009063 [Syzygium grande]